MIKAEREILYRLVPILMLIWKRLLSSSSSLTEAAAVSSLPSFNSFPFPSSLDNENNNDSGAVIADGAIHFTTDTQESTPDDISSDDSADDIDNEYEVKVEDEVEDGDDGGDARYNNEEFVTETMTAEQTKEHYSKFVMKWHETDPAARQIIILYYTEIYTLLEKCDLIFDLSGFHSDQLVKPPVTFDHSVCYCIMTIDRKLNYVGQIARPGECRDEHKKNGRLECP